MKFTFVFQFGSYGNYNVFDDISDFLSQNLLHYVHILGTHSYRLSRDFIYPIIMVKKGMKYFYKTFPSFLICTKLKFTHCTR